MEKVKLINIKTKVIKEVPKELVDDYLGTNEYKLFKEEIHQREEERPLKNNNNHKKVINVRSFK